MGPRDAIRSFFALIAIAAVGAALLAIPPFVVSQYQTVSALGKTWGYLYLGAVALGAALFVGATGRMGWKLWAASREKNQKRISTARGPKEMSLRERTKEIDENLNSIGQLREDAKLSPQVVDELKPLVDRFEEKRLAQKLEIVAFGTVSSGKSSLLNALAGQDLFETDPKGGTTIRRSEVPWPGQEQVFLVDAPGLGEIDGAAHIAIAAEAARDADLVMLVVDGPLRQSEFRLLDQLGKMQKRMLICLNKADWYSQADREKLRRQIAAQASEYVAATDVVAVQASTIERSRVRVLTGGEESQEHVQESPDISQLAEKMLQIVQRDGQDLLLANLLLQSRGLVESAREHARAALDRQAWKIVERTMWTAGGAAALSPWPLVDIAAGCAISSKMVIDLSKVYKQNIDLDSAVKLLGELGKNLIAILGVSAATPIVGTLAAGLLKTIPGAGTIAGGLLQGVVQALVTRWIGGVFIVYFRNEMQFPEGGLTGVARREWQKATSILELKKLLDQARSHLR
jgi:predicted GTPase/uncharacterized protein (DUF697 family)